MHLPALVRIVCVLGAVALTCAGCTAAPASRVVAPSASTAPVGPLLFEWYPDDGPKTLYLAGEDGSDVQQITGGVAPGTAHVHADWAPDGRSIAFEALDEDGGTSAIWTVRADGSKARRIATCTADPCAELSYPAYSPDGRQLLVVQFDSAVGGRWGRSRLVAIDLASGRRTEIASTPDGESSYYNPRWSPDGRSIAVQVETHPNAAQSSISGMVVAIVSIADGSVHPITPPALFGGHPDFRRSDSLIVFDTYDLSAFDRDDHDSDLYTVRPDGTGLRRLTRTRSVDGMRIGEPTWAQDGRSVQLTVGITAPHGDGMVLADAHLGTATYPGGQVADSGVPGAGPRLRPGTPR